MSFSNANQAIQKFINVPYRTTRFSTIDAVMDARGSNTSIVEQISNITGKLRELKISYYPIQCDAVADNCSATVCDNGEAQEPIQQYFNLSQCIQSKVQVLNRNDVRDVDNEWDFSMHAMTQIRAMMGSLNGELDSRILALILANAGVLPDGNATRRVTMSNTQTGVFNPIGLWEIEKDFADGAFTNPYIIGSTEVFNWQKALGIATENNTTGMDYARLNDTNMYYDTRLNTVAGDLSNGEHIIAFDPQALKFVTFNYNLGIFATDIASPEQMDRMFKRGGTDYAYGVITDPATGITWDFVMRYDECNDRFTWFLRLYWDIFFPRIQVCNVEGVNGIFHYRTCPLVIAPCPTGESPLSPVAATTYSWTPSVSYPDYIHDFILGGVVNKPEVTVTNIATLAAMMNDAYGVPDLFTVNGSDIEYSGYSALTGFLNQGADQIVVTFS